MLFNEFKVPDGQNHNAGNKRKGIDISEISLVTLVH